MIQDIFPHALHNEYQPRLVPTAENTVLCFRGEELLVRPDGHFPTAGELGQRDYRYLFAVDDRRYFLLMGGDEIPQGDSYESIRQLRRSQRLSREEIYAAFTGKHLADWYRDAQFCGRCGTKTAHSERERAMVCPSCGKTFYPRIMPAVIVGIKNGERLLLTRYRTGFTPNALVAGFTEIGETAEETVRREVMEEVGVRVKNIRYFASQPWGIANDLLLGYYCELDGDETIRMDEHELKYAQWVRREDIELQPDDLSLTNEMMRRFKLGLEP